MASRCVQTHALAGACAETTRTVPHPVHEALSERFAGLALRYPNDCLACFAEFIQISKAVAIGFAVMGFIGYFVKLIHIPM